MDDLKHISDMLKQLAEISENLNIPIITSSQVHKTYDKKESLKESKILEDKRTMRRINKTACLIGSMRYKEDFPIISRKYTEIGYNIMYSPFSDYYGILKEDKMEALFLQSSYDRIDASDLVIVVNRDHIGMHTMIEIAYAIYKKKPVVYSMDRYNSEESGNLPVLEDYSSSNNLAIPDSMIHTTDSFSKKIALIIQVLQADDMLHPTHSFAKRMRALFTSRSQDTIVFLNELLPIMNLKNESMMHLFLIDEDFSIRKKVFENSLNEIEFEYVISGTINDDYVNLGSIRGWKTDHDMTKDYLDLTDADVYIFATDDLISEVFNANFENTTVVSTIVEAYA